MWHNAIRMETSHSGGTAATLPAHQIHMQAPDEDILVGQHAVRWARHGPIVALLTETVNKPVGQDQCMQITAKSDYALRAMCVLAVADAGVSVKAADIAAGQDIPPTFLDGILVQLRRGGMVSSRRGPGGGHQLARPAWSITLADVVRVIDGPLTLIHGQRPEELAHDGPAARLQDVWVAVRAALRAIMEETTLEQVVTGALPPAVAALAEDNRSWTSIWPLKS